MGQIAQWANLPEWNETVTIIQLLNEPTLWDDYDYRFMRLKEYYDKAYKEIRKYNDMVVISIHDAFIDYSNWYYFGENPEYKRVMLDAHLYQVRLFSKPEAGLIFCSICRFSETNGL